MPVIPNFLLLLLNIVTVVVFFDLPTLTIYNTLIIDDEYDYVIGKYHASLPYSSPHMHEKVRT